MVVHAHFLRNYTNIFQSGQNGNTKGPGDHYPRSDEDRGDEHAQVDTAHITKYRMPILV
ncbi:MAG: hypothetical protein R2794_11445 [Chitinophagales bacterium]